MAGIILSCFLFLAFFKLFQKKNAHRFHLAVQSELYRNGKVSHSLNNLGTPDKSPSKRHFLLRQDAFNVTAFFSPGINGNTFPLKMVFYFFKKLIFESLICKNIDIAGTLAIYFIQIGFF